MLANSANTLNNRRVIKSKEEIIDENEVEKNTKTLILLIYHFSFRKIKIKMKISKIVLKLQRKF
jgi:hypothetical protein